jgi:hypothetical protein
VCGFTACYINLKQTGQQRGGFPPAMLQRDSANLRIILRPLTGVVPEVGDCWPLNDEQLSTINRNSRQLVDILDTDDDLIANMMSTSCLAFRQLTDLREEANLGERNRKFVEMLKRRSVDHFRACIVCLENTQRHVIPLMTGQTGMFFMLVIPYYRKVFSLFAGYTPNDPRTKRALVIEDVF